MARPRGPYSSPLHQKAAERAHREWKSAGMSAAQSALGMGAYGGAITIHIDLKPLANALRDIPIFQGEAQTILVRGINRALARFKGMAHRDLKALTKIRQPTRLKRGVTIIPASAGRFVGTYTITDRHIRITKAYFGAAYKPYGIPGGMARAGRKFSPAGATWTSWDGKRTGKRTFMVPGAEPVFIRLGGAKRFPIVPVFGPNPAELMQLNAPQFQNHLTHVANEYVERRMIDLYRKNEMKAKRRWGL